MVDQWIDPETFGAPPFSGDRLATIYGCINDAVQQIDHPPVVVMLSPTGLVTRYLNGQTMDPVTFRAWCEERADLAVASALADPAVDGVHLMPVTAGGYEAVARLADIVHTLTE